MDQELFQIEVTPGDGTCTLQFAGEVDYAASLEIMPRLRELTNTYPEELLLDLENVTFMDSEGVKLLIAAHRLMNAQDGRAKIISLSPCVERILKLTGMDAFLIPKEEESIIAHDM